MEERDCPRLNPQPEHSQHSLKASSHSSSPPQRMEPTQKGHKSDCAELPTPQPCQAASTQGSETQHLCDLLWFLCNTPRAGQLATAPVLNVFSWNRALTLLHTSTRCTQFSMDAAQDEAEFCAQEPAEARVEWWFPRLKSLRAAMNATVKLNWSCLRLSAAARICLRSKQSNSPKSDHTTNVKKLRILFQNGLSALNLRLLNILKYEEV